MHNKKELFITLAVIIITILLAVLPMSLSPSWNGEIPMHRNQYEEITKSFLKGKLSFDYEVNPKLLELDNPYDPELRVEKFVAFKWDHALYNGKYYMYFGVAPVIFTFLPYKVITGNDLTTYHATQLYIGLYIVGVFLLFNFLRKRVFKEDRFYLSLLVSSVFGLLSSWVCITQPALYCTAISAGLCFAMFAIYAFVKATYSDFCLNKRILYYFIGGLCGALIFACRPPLGFINLILPVVIFIFIKNNKLSKKELLKLLYIITPYISVAILLMTYNYLRFDSPFEFGQTYQLTSYDQHLYSSFLGNFNLKKVFSDLCANLFYFAPLTKTFPYIGISGVFINFPILLYPYVMMMFKDYRSKLKENKLFWFNIALLCLPIIISIIDSIFSPVRTYRYYLDLYFIMIISSYIAIMISKQLFNKKTINIFITIVMIITFITVVLLIFIPNDNNFAEYYKNLLPKIDGIISFWR